MIYFDEFISSLAERSKVQHDTEARLPPTSIPQSGFATDCTLFYFQSEFLAIPLRPRADLLSWWILKLWKSAQGDGKNPIVVVHWIFNAIAICGRSFSCLFHLVIECTEITIQKVVGSYVCSLEDQDIFKFILATQHLLSHYLYKF